MMTRDNLPPATLPPLNALHAFEVAGRHLNFRRASEELGVSAGAVSQQVRKLEAVLGVILFDRRADGVALSEQGRAFHGRLLGIFGELRQASASLHPQPQIVTISATPTVASKWLIPRLPEFASLHPDIDLEIVATDRVVSFRSERIDLAIRQSASSFGSGVRAERLFDQDLIAVCAPALVAGETLPIPEDRLASLPLLNDAEGSWNLFFDDAARSDGSVARGPNLGTTSLCLDAALSGQGVALASRFLVARELADGRLVQPVARAVRGPDTFYLVGRRDSRQRPAIEILRRWILDTRYS